MRSILLFLKGCWSSPLPSSYHKFSLYLISLVLVFFIIQSGALHSAQLQPDSGTYISYSIIRTALYPLVIGLFNFLFGNFGLQALVLFQVTSAIILSYLVAHFLQKIFYLNFLAFLFILGIFFTPLMYNYSNIILSEGLAYPLFLACIYCLFLGLSKHQLSYFYAFSVLLLLLCLTRQQYIVLYVVGGAAWIYLLYHKIFSGRSGVKWLASLISSFALLFISECTYHYSFHGFFGLTPFSGSQMLVAPLYLSNKNDTILFPSHKLQDLHASLIKKLDQKNIIGEQAEPTDFHGFSLFYNAMQHKVILPTLSQTTLENHPLLNATDLTRTVNQTALEMSWVLIKEDPIKYLKFYIHLFVNGSGGYYPLFFSLFFLGMGTIFSCLKRSVIFPLLVLSILANLGNTALVSFFEPPMTRYTYGPMILMYSIFAAFIFYLCAKNQSLFKELQG